MRRTRQATGRASLAPVERRKAGKVYWQARGSVPVREADGSVGSRRIERGFGPDCKTARDRERRCAELNLEYEARFNNPRKMISFSRAFTNYLGAQHPTPYYAEKLIEELGNKQCLTIDDTDMVNLVDDIWPDGASAATINRHLYTPVIAVLQMALKREAPDLTRPKGHRDVMPVIIPPTRWYRDVAPILSADQLAFVMFLAMHGRRTNEALGRRPRDLNEDNGILDLGKTKTGVRQIELHPGSLALIRAMSGWRSREWLFGSGPSSGDSFRRDLKARIVKAGLPWYYPHSFGRHNSVTRMLRAKYSTKHTADAHGMTEEMVARRYGHLTRQEVMAALHEVGGDLLNEVMGGKLGERLRASANKDVYKPLILEAKPSALPDDESLPSEGSALSICATGATGKSSNTATSNGIARRKQARTGQERTARTGGNEGDTTSRPKGRGGAL